MKTENYYVTYRWRLIHGNVSRRFAIKFHTYESALDCARDIYSYCGIMRVNINVCGRLPKGTVVLDSEEYRNGKFLNYE